MTDDKHKAFRKRIAESQIIGSRGEMFVAFLLSQFCLVRPVANGTDVGVDLYCEALVEGVPHGHFWVQVKTRKKSISKQMRFHAKDLEYWSRQPIPVFVFFVSDSAMELDKYKINVINLTEKSIEEPFLDPKSTPSRTLVSDFSITSVEELKRFVFSQVPETIARQFLRDGVLFPVKPTAHDQYLKSYRSVHIHRFSRLIMKNIGRTAALLLNDILKHPREELKLQRAQLEQILETFIEWGNADFHFSLGLSKMSSLKYQDAIRCFERSCRNIQDDGNLSTELKARELEKVSSYISMCRRKTQG
jgi:hypothetical protein